MGAPVIRLAGVGKRYTKYDDQPMLISALRLRQRTRRSRLWALRDVDLEIGAGEAVGIIGRNGSGKSTMLQLLGGITAPTEGEVAVRGRVAPLVSVGVGFHPELTGRENVLVNGTILGMSREEVAERYDEIVAFSEIGDFIDTPVKFYSSGMYVRLGFSVAIHARPDILLVDEVLAVGDFAFQMKCFDRMMAIREAGTTIVVVTHNLNAVRMMCPRSVLLHRGVVRYDGDTGTAISHYHRLLGEVREPETGGGGDGARWEGGRAVVETLSLHDSAGAPTAHVHAGDAVTARARVRFDADVADPSFNCVVLAENGDAVYTEGTSLEPTGLHRAGERVDCEVALRMRLVTGSYRVRLTVTGRDGTLYDRSPLLPLYVSGRTLVGGVADLGGRFTLRRDGGDAVVDAAGARTGGTLRRLDAGADPDAGALLAR